MNHVIKKVMVISALLLLPYSLKSNDIETLKAEIKLLSERVEYLVTEIGNLKEQLEAHQVLKKEAEIHDEATTQEKPIYKVCLKDRCKKISGQQVDALAQRHPHAQFFKCHKGTCQCLKPRGFGRRRR